MQAITFALILSIVTLSISGTFGQEFIIRETTHGTIRGYTVPFVDAPDWHLDAFVGIPYATPPLGDLRFRRTVDAEPWSGTLDTTRFSPCCPQVMDSIRSWSFGPTYNNSDEDCLYLNVFSPRNLVDEFAKYPVMVWIHGGSYRYGSGEEYDSRMLVQRGHVVVVTINYRLGVLGLLSTDDNVAPGNYGLLDMVHALGWVKNNIVKFGGDPSRITVFGNSAGGAATSLLGFSQLTQGLFHRLIPQSGDALSPWAIYRPPYAQLQTAQELAVKVNCTIATPAEMVACLRTKDANLLVHTSVSSPTDFNAAWAPRVDDYFITDVPENLLDAGNVLPVDLLTGTVPDEMTDTYTGVEGIENGWSREEKDSRMYSWSRRYVNYADYIYNGIMQQYNWPGDDWQKNRDVVIEMRSDDGYIAPHNRHVRQHSRIVPNTYLYAFEYRTRNHPEPAWMGVPHFEECYYTFGTPFWGTNTACPWGCLNVVWFNRQNWTQEDSVMSSFMMESWTNFAKTGPTTMSCAGERSLTLLALACGLIGTGALSLALVTDFWLFTQEQYASPDLQMTLGNETIPEEALGVKMHSGLWRACTYYDQKEGEETIPSVCTSIGYSSQSFERIEGADTTNSILRGIRRAAPIMVADLVLLCIAFCFSTLGNAKRNKKTVIGTIFYMASALCLAVGVIVYISAVNDEVAYRKKSEYSEEPSFTYHYGWAFFFVGCAFVSAMAASVLNVTLYMRRFRKLDDTLAIVPSLE